MIGGTAFSPRAICRNRRGENLLRSIIKTIRWRRETRKKRRQLVFLYKSFPYQPLPLSRIHTTPGPQGRDATSNERKEGMKYLNLAWNRTCCRCQGRINNTDLQYSSSLFCNLMPCNLCTSFKSISLVEGVDAQGVAANPSPI